MEKSTSFISDQYVFVSLILVGLTLTTCIPSNKRSEKEPLFLADREAPIGWSYLEIYEDSTFEFIGVEYQGVVSIQNDTFKFNYIGAVPRAGKEAIVKGDYLLYTKGKYREKLMIKLNRINHPTQPK